MIDKSKIHNILFITLSNIGDVILTLPVLGALEKEFPSAKITVMTSVQCKELFENDPAVKEIIPYDKHIALREKLNLVISLRKRGFDLAVDLRCTLFPLLINARHRTALFADKKPQAHKKFAHLGRLDSLGINTQGADYNIFFNEADGFNIKNIFANLNISDYDKIVAVAAGAKSHIKRWSQDGFAEVCRRLIEELRVKVVLIGDDSDKKVNRHIVGCRKSSIYDLSSKTTLRELGYLLRKCKLLITNDSAPLHLAGLVKTPTVAIFGPTDDKKYGPLFEKGVVVRKNLKCTPCEKAQCVFNLECMRQISADEVFDAALKLLHTQC